MSMLNEVRPSNVPERDRSFKGRIKDFLPWKGDSTKEIIRKVVYIGSLCALLWCGYNFIEYRFGTSDMYQETDYLQSLYHSDVGANDEDPAESETPAVTDASSGETDADNQSDEQSVVTVYTKYPVGMLEDFESLYDINSDIVGWLTIESFTDDDGSMYIDYPVVQTTDNDYYLTHNFFGIESSYGCLFADYSVPITYESQPRNIIIYGHSMASGTYFRRLLDYKGSVSTVSKNRVVNFSTLYDDSEYIIFACFIVGIYDYQDTLPLFRYHTIFDWSDITEFDYWYQNILYRNYFTTDIECTMDDEYITLSTCSYEVDDLRCVIVARKLREGENPDDYTYKYNTNVRLPAAVYIAQGKSVPDGEPNYQYYGVETESTDSNSDE